MNYSKSLEKEAKYLVSESEYCKLVAVANETSTMQKNYYFDLFQYEEYKNALVRIREKNQQFEMTVKQRNAKYNNTFVSQEFNRIIQKMEFEYYLNNGIGFSELPIKFNATDDKNRLRYIGYLVTHRTRLPITKNGMLFVDKNEYLGITDFEVEFEYMHDEDLEKFKAFIIQEGIMLTESKSKFARFMAFLQVQNKT